MSLSPDLEPSNNTMFDVSISMAAGVAASAVAVELAFVNPAVQNVKKAEENQMANVYESVINNQHGVPQALQQAPSSHITAAEGVGVAGIGVAAALSCFGLMKVVRKLHNSWASDYKDRENKIGPHTKG